MKIVDKSDFLNTELNHNPVLVTITGYHTHRGGRIINEPTITTLASYCPDCDHMLIKYAQLNPYIMAL